MTELSDILGMDPEDVGTTLTNLKSSSAGVAVTASGAGYETYNQYAQGYGITEARQGVEVSTPAVSEPVLITKSENEGSSVLYGAYIRVPYDELSDLDKIFRLNAKVLSGQPFTYIRILRIAGDWNPANFPIYLSTQQVNQLREGGEGLNLYNIVTESIYDSQYQSLDHFYIIIGDSDGTAANNNAKEGVWSIQPRFDSNKDVVANKLTAGLRQELEGGTDLMKVPLGNIGTTSTNDTSASAEVDEEYRYDFGEGMVSVGYDATFFNDPSETSTAYARARLFEDYDTEGVGKTFRIYIQSLDKESTTLFLRLTNAGAWGSADGFTGQYHGQTVTLSEANDYQFYVDFEYDDFASFYADEDKHRDGYYLIGYQGEATGPAKSLSTYCVDITDYTGRPEAQDPYVPKLSPALETLTARTDAIQTEVDSLVSGSVGSYITAWGDSLTSGGGWTSRIEELSGITVYNGGTGGEQSDTIAARQGGDAMIVNNITIPAGTTPVVIADRDVDGGIPTQLGATVTPLLQGAAHFNPCFIGDVEGTLAWTGSNHSDMTGDWTFTRTEAGTEVTINRPTAIRTDFDINRNGGIQILFIGQNGGYDSDIPTLIQQHRRMMAHSSAKFTVVMGLSSGTEAQRSAYEEAMTEEFGRYFISLRKYLTTPIYGEDGETLVSCYGLEDAGLTATQNDLDDIAIGKTPPQLLADGVHYTASTKTVIGNMMYLAMRDLGLFKRGNT